MCARVQAPFYAVAIFAFVRRANWIRLPAIVYSTVLLIIMPSAPDGRNPFEQFRNELGF